MATLPAQDVLLELARAGVPLDAGSLARWLSIAKAESSLNPMVVNRIGAVGLYQINQPVHVRAHPDWTVSWLQVPANNIAAARTLSLGWTSTRPWAASVLGQTAYYPSSHTQAVEFLRSGTLDAVAGAVGAASDPGGALAQATGVTALANTVGALTNPHTWLRVAYGVVGVVLIAAAAYSVVNSRKAGQMVIKTVRRKVAS